MVHDTQMKRHGRVPVTLLTKASRIFLVGSSLSALELDSIPELQIPELLLQVFKQLARRAQLTGGRPGIWTQARPSGVAFIGPVPFPVAEKQGLWSRGEMLLDKTHNSSRTCQVSRAWDCWNIYSLSGARWLLCQWEVGLAKIKIAWYECQKIALTWISWTTLGTSSF